MPEETVREFDQHLKSVLQMNKDEYTQWAEKV